MNINKSNTLLNINLTIISLVIFFYVLYIGSSFIIPFVIALFLAFSIISTYSFFKKHIKNSFVSFIITALIYGFIFWIVANIINKNIEDILLKSSFYQDQLRFLIDKNVLRFGLEEGEFYQKLWNYIDLQRVFNSMATLITNMFSYIGIILFYLIFILLEYKFFSKKLDLIISDKDKRKKVFDIIHEIRQDVKSYFLIKTFVSLLTGLFSYMVMKSVGLDFAMFWAFLIFILNFIPNIGSVIAVIFPAVLSLIQFDGHVNFFIVLSGLILIQMIVGNIIDPKLTGNKLNLSPLVILLALVFWGLIWGFVGAILSVPIMVIISIIFSKFEETKPLAILLSEKGVLKSNLDIELTKAEIKTLQKVKNFFVNK